MVRKPMTMESVTRERLKGDEVKDIAGPDLTVPFI